jgi:chemotaxis methyl-accepting protein methylase
MHELLERENVEFEHTIFATDLDKYAIQFARRGIYEAPSLKEVKMGILSQYFKQEGDSYKVTGEVKKGVNFSIYDLLDPANYAPPESVFGNFDLILCRNVLIYFNPEYQKIIFSKMIRSLSKGGFLVLGEAESISPDYTGAFKEVNRFAKVFQKNSHYED